MSYEPFSQRSSNWSACWLSTSLPHLAGGRERRYTPYRSLCLGTFPVLHPISDGGQEPLRTSQALAGMTTACLLILLCN